MKQKSIGFRVNEDLKDRFDAICGFTGVDTSTIGRELVRAVVEHVERTGEISFPLSIRSGSPERAQRVQNGRESSPVGASSL